MKKINFSFYILLLLVIQIVLADSLIYFLKLNYTIANIIAIVVNFIFNFFIIKKKLIEIKSDFCRWDLFAFVIIAAMIGISIMIPDASYDTYSYHIYLQESPFVNKINSDFFPGRTLTSYVFPLADRIFYLFRVMLGYRLGTVIGYLLLIVIFYQIKNILKYMLKGKIQEKYISILSVLPLFTYALLEELGEYYIDIFSVVFILEIIYVTICERRDIIKEKFRLYYLLFIVGICVSMKISNVVYVLMPFIIIFIQNIKDLKKIKWYEYFAMIFVCLLPVLTYVIYNIIQTGNPVYPYYNKIFKSKYFLEENWLDTRYGPQNIIQTLLWPIYIYKHPEKFYEIPTVDIMWGVGYILGILYLIKTFIDKIFRKKEVNKDKVIFAILILATNITWAKFALGYQRYGIVIPIMSEVFVIVMFLESVLNKKIIYNIIAASIIVYSMCTAYNLDMIYDNNLLRSIKIKDSEGIHSILENVKYLFKDRKTEKYDIDGIWGVIYDNSAIPELLNVDDSLVHLERGTKTTASEITEKKYWEYVNENDIYIPTDNTRLGATISYLNLYKFKIENIEKVMLNVNFLPNTTNYIYILKVSYDENCNNNLDDMSLLEKNNLELKLENDNTQVSAFLSINTDIYIKNLQDGVKVNVFGVDSNNQKELIDTIKLGENEEFLHYTTDISVQKFNKVIFEIDDSDNQEDDYVRVINLNAQ